LDLKGCQVLKWNSESIKDEKKRGKEENVFPLDEV
jgi:hypothetical protein